MRDDVSTDLKAVDTDTRDGSLTLVIGMFLLVWIVLIQEAWCLDFPERWEGWFSLRQARLGPLARY